MIKPHPAETAAGYAAALSGQSAAITAPAALDLASLLAVSAVVVTVNSTVAIDAMVLGIPGMVVGLPNNLSPFVERRAMAGVGGGGRQTGSGMADALTLELSRLTGDEEYRAGLLEQARIFAAEYGVKPDGQSARRAAAEILGAAARIAPLLSGG